MNKITRTILALFLLGLCLEAQDKSPTTAAFWRERYFQARSATARGFVCQSAARRGDSGALTFLEQLAEKAGKAEEGLTALRSLGRVAGYPFVDRVFKLAGAAPQQERKRTILSVLTEDGPHRQAAYHELLRRLEVHQADSHGLLLLDVLSRYVANPVADGNQELNDLLLAIYEGPAAGPLRARIHTLSRELPAPQRRQFDISALVLLDREFALPAARNLLADEVDGVEDLLVALFADNDGGYFRARLDDLLSGTDRLLLRLRFLEVAEDMSWRQLEYLRHTQLAHDDDRLKNFLIGALEDPGEKKQILALWMIRSLHEKSAAMTLRHMRERELPESVRLLVEDTLALLTGKKQYISNVKRMLSEGDFDDQLRRLNLARRVHLGGPHLEGWLRSKLKATRSNWKLQGSLIRLAGDMQLPETISLCEDALDSKRWQVRLAAIEALIDFGSRAALSRLATLTDDPQQRLARTASDGLRQLTGMNLGANPDGWRRVIGTLGSHWRARRMPLREPVRADAGRYGPQFYGLDIRSNRVIFVCDISGSMRGRKILELKSELQRAIKGIVAPQSAFNIIFFAGHIDAVWSRLAHIRPRTREKAKKAIGSIQANGGTNVYGALEKAYADTLADTLVVLTDGQPSVGKVTDTESILAQIHRWNRWKRLQIHTVYLPEDADTDSLRVIPSQRAADFMRRLAAIGGGQYVEPR